MSEECVTRNQTFEDIYGINTTKINCEMAHYKTSPYSGQNCSVLPYYRWNTSESSPRLKGRFIIDNVSVDNLRPCIPSDALAAAASKGSSDPSHPTEESSPRSPCLKSCSENQITYKGTSINDICTVERVSLKEDAEREAA